MKILIIEDEKVLGGNMLEYLKGDNNVCDLCLDLHHAIKRLETITYDVVLLDIGLPDGDGFEILNFLGKKQRSEAIIIISARNSLDDRLRGLNIGADDYLVKPFYLAELRARIMAVLRRKVSNDSALLTFNEITADLNERTVMIGPNNVVFTRKEFDMLIYFIANKNKVVTKSALVEHLYGDEMDMHDDYNFLYSHIKNFRKKILDNTTHDYLRSIYGIGYKFTDK